MWEAYFLLIYWFNITKHTVDIFHPDNRRGRHNSLNSADLAIHIPTPWHFVPNVFHKQLTSSSYSRSLIHHRRAAVTGKQQDIHTKWTVEEKIRSLPCSVHNTGEQRLSKLAGTPGLAFYFLNKLLIDF